METIDFKNLKKNGVLFVNDLFDENGSFYEYNLFCEKSNVRINILHYYGLRNALHDIFDFTKVKAKLVMPIRPLCYNVLLKRMKGCQIFYKMLNNSSVLNNSNVKSKWEDILSLQILEKDWININRFPFKHILSTKFQWFHYRLVNRILGTNVLLNKIDNSYSDRCTFCSLEKESYTHLFYFCDKVTSFRVDFIKWVSDNTHIRLFLSPKSVIMGCNELSCNNTLNFVLICLKFFIYKCRCKKIIPFLPAFKNELNAQWKCERYIFYSSGNKEKFDSLWKDWISLFQ